MSIKDEIKARLDIVDLINETVTLTDCGGGEWKGAINPESQSGKSLNVNRDMQAWYDWPSGTFGDVLTWIAHINSLDIKKDFKQVLSIAADKGGVPLDTNGSYNDTNEVYTLLRAATQWCHNKLTTDHRAHMHAKWGLTDETIDKYKIGYAPGGGDATALQAALSEVFPVELIRSSGLFNASNKGWVSHYQDRIVFPYWLGGNVVYSIARSMAEGEKDKYLKHLTKGPKHKYVDPSIKNVIFGQDSLKGADHCIITEGITDCLMVLQAGIPCVSPVTVQFQKDDYIPIVTLVKGLKTVYVCNDNETSRSGAKGAKKTVSLLQSEGINVCVIDLPRPEGVDKIDLADFLRDNPVDDFKELMKGAPGQDTTAAETCTPEILEMANMLLDEGDPFNFIFDTWNETHIGDKRIGQTSLMSVASSYIKNTKGVHVKPSGNSGEGKSDALNTMLHLLPPGKYITGSLSSKSLFYDDDLKAGCIICNDDQKLNEDLVDTLKQSTSKYQEVTYHRTVKKQERSIFSIPERVTFWLAGVDGFDDDQMGNRFINVDVDETPEQDLAVYKKQVDEEYILTNDDEVTDQVLVCREIFNLISKNTYNVKIPFTDSIKWFNKDNRRNFPMFKDMIRAIALFKHRQGRTFGGVVLATVDDYKEAKEIYQQLSENNATNLTDNELKVMEYLQLIGEAEIKDIAKAMDCSVTTARNYMHGRDKYVDGGLLAKVPGIHLEQINTNVKELNDTADVWTSTTTKRNIYVCETDRFDKDSYKYVVAIDEDKALKEFTTAVDTLTAITPETPQKHPTITFKKIEKPLLVDIINKNILNNRIMYKGNGGAVVGSNNHSDCDSLTLKQVKNVIVPADNDKGCNSGVFPCESGLDSETQTERLNKLKPAVDRFERFKQCNLDKHNYKDCASEFIRLNPGLDYEQVLSDLRHGWNISDNGSQPDTIKIKLDIPKSAFTFDGVQYSLSRGDIANIPTAKARDMISQGKAVEAQV